MSDLLAGRPDLEREMASWAAEGATIALEYFRRTGPLNFKHGREVVTEADRRIEELLRERIASAYPDDRICGEEMADGGTPGAARTWHLDPIDGTLNFALGLPGYCTSIALLAGDRPLAACVLQPSTGDVYTATAGQGACLNGKPITVSERAPLIEAVLSTQLKKDSRIVQNPHLLQALLLHTMKIRRVGAIALELAWTAAGSYDALLAGFTDSIQVYDVAAGLLLVQEAGGMITDLEGQSYHLGGGEMLASNGRIHQELVDLIARF